MVSLLSISLLAQSLLHVQAPPLASEPSPSESAADPGTQPASATGLPVVTLPAGVTEIAPPSEVPSRVDPPPPEPATVVQQPPVTESAPPEDDGQAAENNPGAEQKPNNRYVARPGKTSFGGFGGIRLRPSGVGRYFGLFFGGAGGMVAGKFYLGGAGYGMFRDFGEYRLSTGEELDLSIGYGGVLMGGEVLSVGPFSFGVQGLIGAGSACLSYESPDIDDPACFDSSALFIVEPELQVRLRIARSLRIGVNGGYRFVVSSEWLGPSNFQLAGPTGALVVDFGWF